MICVSARKGLRVVALCGVFACLMASARADVDMFASQLVSATGLGAYPYDNALAALGKPTVTFAEPNGKVFACSVVAGAWNLSPSGDPIITTIETGGELVAGFATPIEDDPANWFGRDFIIFGNAAFNGVTSVYLTPTTDMAAYQISATGAGRWEKSTVSVSQYPNGPWYTFTNGPYSDDFAPTQSYAWDYVKHTWGPEMDFTKPVDPALTSSSFGGKTAAAAIDMYKSSSGGTAFDISGLDLPVNTAGRKWIQYIRVTGNGGEVDAFARVGHTISPISIAAAKLLPDGARVILSEQIVSAGTSEMGDCCYIESPDRFTGIRVIGRILDRESRVLVQGVMGTANGEREIRSTSADATGTDSVKPLGMNGRCVATAIGLSSTGLLVRTWGRVGNIDTTARTWTIDDGSGSTIACIAPPDDTFALPTDGSIVRVTGISTYTQTTGGRLVTALRVRASSDLQ